MRRSVTVQRRRWPKNPTGIMAAIQPYKGKGPHKNDPLREADLLAAMRHLWRAVDGK